MHGDPQILFIVIIALCHALQISYVCHRVHREHMRELRFEDRVLQHHGRCGEPSDALLSGSTRFIYRPGQLVRISVRACAIGWILRGVCAPVFAVEGVEYGRDCCGGVGCSMVPGLLSDDTRSFKFWPGSDSVFWCFGCCIRGSVPDQIAIWGIRVLEGSSWFTFACVTELV
jgi:hypothetical protein